MYKVFAADIRRLLKNKNFYHLNVLWVVEYGLMFVLFFGVLDKFLGIDKLYAENIFLQGISVLPLISSIFVGSYMGEEFRDGTIRNKIIRGAGRLEIYASAICYTIFVSLLTQVVLILTSLLFGYIFLDGCMSVSGFIIRSGIFILAGIAISVFFTGLIYILGSSKVSYVICPSLTITFYFLNTFVEYKLYPQSGLSTLTSGMQKAFLFVDKYIPLTYFYGDLMHNADCYIIGSIGLALLGIAAGAVVFLKKDLK